MVVNTNVFVHACNPHYPFKKTTAETLLRELWIEHGGRTGAGAVEYYATVTRKLNG